MSISALSSTNLSTTALTRVASPTRAWQNLDDNQASSATTGTSGSSRFATAISDAFAKLGISLDPSTGSVTSTGSTTDTSSTDDTSDAIGAFLQSLFAALHSQSAGAPPPPPAASDTDTQAAASTTASTPAATDATATSEATTQPRGAHGHHGHGGGGGKLEGDLQSLIQQLTTSTSTDDATTTDATTDATTSTGDATSLATLEKTFDALLSKSGATATTGDSLTSFLQTLAQNLHGAPATGNVVTTSA